MELSEAMEGLMNDLGRSLNKSNLVAKNQIEEGNMIINGNAGVSSSH